MLYNYLKTSLRSLLKNKLFSLINIFGLALGITCVFLILQYVKREFAYDHFHNGAENIYRVSWETDNPQTRTPHPLAQAMVKDFPDVENAVSLTPLWGPGLTRQTFSIRNIEKNIQYDEMGVLAVDTTFFKVFSFPIVRGNANEALKKVRGILISEKAAARYFGDEDPVGKFLSINNDKVLIEVVGVFKDVPELSHFHFDFLVSYLLEKALEDPESEFFTWSDFGHYNYVKLKPGTDAKKLEAELTPWLAKYQNWSPEDIKYLSENHYGLKLQPITDIHLKSDLRWELEPNGNIEYVYMMIAAAVLILVIGCINFINLSTAQSSERAKEIGVRKAMGAFRRQLIFQFTGESVLITSIAVALSVAFIQILLPFFNAVADYHLSFSFSSLIAILAVVGLFVGIIAGIYPSMHLSAVKPAAVLKGKLLQSPKGVKLRRAFTVLQFCASMVLICASAVIYQQLDFIKHRSLGFNKEEVVVIPIKNRDAIRDHVNELEHELSQLIGVVKVSATSNIPGRSFNQHTFTPATDLKERVDASEVMIDYDFLKVLDIPMVSGRDFMRTNPADADQSFLLNETAAKQLGATDAVGKEIIWDRDGEKIKGTVVGIVRDFNFQSLHLPVRPLLFKLEDQAFNFIVVKINTASFRETISDIEKTWKKFDNRFAFDFFFLSDSLNQQYRGEEKMAEVIIAFSAIAVLIACFGLLGIAALTFRTKTKEVSIRKVLGADFSNLVFLLVKDFTLLILIAIFIAVPLSIWMMSGWLQNFSYRVHLSPWIFIGSGLILIFLAWITLAYLTLRVVKLNPAITLKNE
jgi:putative ABC transport system permease protein